MADFIVTDPSGKDFVVTAPAGATPELVLSYAKAKFGKPTRAPDALDDPNMAVSGMGSAERFRAGMGKAFSDLGTGIQERIGLADPSEVDAARKRDAALMSTTGGKVGDLVGNLAIAAPTAMIPGVNSVVGGAALGGALGALQPTGAGDSVTRNAVEGGVWGGGANAAVRLAPQLIKAAVDPFFKGGRQSLVGDLLNRFGVSGSPTAAATPGWKPTLAEATQSPGAAILERGAGSIDPTIATALTNRGLENNGAAVHALRGLAGSPEEQKLAIAARDYMAGPLYEQAAKDGVDQGMAAALKPQIQNLMARPSMQAVAAKAKQMFGEESIALARNGDVKGLQYMKQAMDDLIEKAGSPTSSVGKNELKGLQQTRSDLVSTMQDLVPKLREADTQYAIFSRPVNESKVAGAMEDKLVPALQSGVDQPARMTANNFAKSLQDLNKQVPKMTGYAGSTVENTMSPGGLKTLEGIKSDMMRRANAMDLGRGAGSNTAQNLASQNIMKQILGPLGLPESWAQAAASSALGRQIGNAGKLIYSVPDLEIKAEIGRALLNPEYAAQLMSKANTPLLTGKTKMAAQLLQLMAAPGALGVANAQKQ